MPISNRSSFAHCTQSTAAGSAPSAVTGFAPGASRSMTMTIVFRRSSLDFATARYRPSGDTTGETTIGRSTNSIIGTLADAVNETHTNATSAIIRRTMSRAPKEWQLNGKTARLSSPVPEFNAPQSTQNVLVSATMNMTIHTRPLCPMPPAPRKYTAADIFFFVDAGLFDQSAEFELLDGEIVPMSPKGNHHEAMREQLMNWLREPWASPFGVMLEHSLTIDDGTILEPDFILYPRSVSVADRRLSGPDIRLIIEVADSSLSFDLNEKAAKYAAFGAGEYWVINARTKLTRIHRGASSSGWADISEHPPGEPLTPLCASTASLRL